MPDIKRHEIDPFKRHIPEALMEQLEKLELAGKSPSKQETTRFLKLVNHYIVNVDLHADDAGYALHRLEKTGATIPRDPLSAARRNYRWHQAVTWAPINRNRRRILGVHLGGFTLRESRALEHAIADRFESLHGCGTFRSVHQVRYPSGRINRSKDGIRRALLRSQLDFHDVVSFEHLTLSGVFGTAERFAWLTDPLWYKRITIRPGTKNKRPHYFTPDVLLFSRPESLGDQVGALLDADKAYQSAGLEKRYEMLDEVLRGVPVSFTRQGDEVLQRQYDDNRLRDAKENAAPITATRIDQMYPETRVYKVGDVEGIASEVKHLRDTKG